jgi:hypothetical protein
VGRRKRKRNQKKRKGKERKEEESRYSLGNWGESTNLLPSGKSKLPAPPTQTMLGGKNG